MKIITINTKDNDFDYLVTVDEFSSRNRIAYMSFSKEKIDHSKLIRLLCSMFGVKDFHRYIDHAGDILIEVTKEDA